MPAPYVQAQTCFIPKLKCQSLRRPPLTRCKPTDGGITHTREQAKTPPASHQVAADHQAADDHPEATEDQEAPGPNAAATSPGAPTANVYCRSLSWNR